ncbi:MAG: hypothetical protein WAU17_06820 [Nitrospirales bacterium]
MRSRRHLIPKLTFPLNLWNGSPDRWETCATYDAAGDFALNVSDCRGKKGGWWYYRDNRNTVNGLPYGLPASMEKGPSFAEQ